MDVGQQSKKNRPSSVHTDNPKTTFFTSSHPTSSLPLPILDLPDNSRNSYIPLGQMVRRKMDAGQQLKEHNLNPPSVHTDNHEPTLVNSDQPTSSPSHPVPDLSNNSKCEVQPHTNRCLQKNDNDCIFGSVASHTDAQSSSTDLISIDKHVAEIDDEAQRTLIQRNTSFSLLSARVGYDDHGSNSNRNESNRNPERGRDRGLNSDPYNTKFSQKTIPSSQYSTTLNEYNFDMMDTEVILNRSTPSLLDEEKIIKKQISANKHHSANTKNLSLTDSNIANVAVTDVSDNVKTQISCAKNLNPIIDNRQMRDDNSAFKKVPAGKCSEENNAVESKEIHDIDEDDLEDVKNIHQPDDKNATDVSKGYEALKGNIQPKDQSCTTDVCQTPLQSPIVYSQTHRKIKKNAKRPFVPFYIKDIELPTQGNLNHNGPTWNTCTVDLLTVIFLQLKLQPGLKTFFIESKAPIFKTVLLLFAMFEEQNFEELRIKWATLLPDKYKKLNFYGTDEEVIFDPFSKAGCFILKINGKVLTIRTCIEIYAFPENCLNLSDIEVMVISYFEAEKIQKTDLQLLEPPPMIILNNWDAGVKIEDVGDLNGTINLGPYIYRVGGFSSLYDRHFSARIMLEEGCFIYDNESEGEEKKYLQGEMSLIFLFRKKT